MVRTKTRRKAAQSKQTLPPAASRPPGDPSVYIVRKGNGGHFVVPSPQFVSRGENNLTFQNFTASDAQVTFPSGIVQPASFSVLAWKTKTVSVAGAKGYYEYQVTLASLRAWGGSDPEIIIDP